jgi:hypothetical protein
MLIRRFAITSILAGLVAVLALPVVPASAQGDTLVTNGSPATRFAQNKQNEPELAVNPANPQIIVAGSNDEIDLEACNAGDDTDCPFTNGVGVSGVYFSFDGGATWTQPTYSGWSARHCLGAPGAGPDCVPHVGPIGTVPNYYENGLVVDGDPALAFGPRRGANGQFSWANGSRLYYSSLTANFSAKRKEFAIKGFEAIAVSYTDNVTAAAAGNQGAWSNPIIVSRQNSALFSDHEAITVDDAASSPFFGNVYICDAAFRSQERSANSLPEPIVLNRSTDGGLTWRQTSLSPAVNNIAQGGRQDCQVDTDSEGNVYVFFDGTDLRTKQFANFMVKSTDGGRHFDRPPKIVTFVNQTGIFDPNQGSLTWDGLGGARDGSAPLVDIANGAPTGAGATDVIYMVYPDGPTPSNTSPGPNEQAFVKWSTNGGRTWNGPINAAPTSDRPLYPAIAVSPNGTDLWVVYDNFLQPWQSTTSNPRLMQGVIRHADIGTGGTPGAFADLHRGPTGDARGSSTNSLVAEFLGDYNAIESKSATRATAVWNDVRNAAHCSPVDAYRQALSTSSPLAKPAPNVVCPATFGNSDIFGGTFLDPTP